MNYNMTKPCDHCPFRSDIDSYLTPERVVEIAGASDFPCHKTTVPELDEFDEETGDMTGTEKSEMCAGFLIIMEKQETPTQMMRIAERLRIYDRSRLEMNSPIYDSMLSMQRAISEAYMPDSETWTKAEQMGDDA